MKTSFPVSCLLLLISAGFAACTPEKTVPAPDASKRGRLSLRFEHVAGGQTLRLGADERYTNAAGEAFSIAKFKYYMSNLRFGTASGAEYAVPADSSYFLIDQEDARSLTVLLDVPEGDYDRVTFVLGVDSLRNTMGVERRTGSLDIAGAGRDMYWAWNSGYIFLKMEGTSARVPAANKLYMLHIGGFGGYSTRTLNNLRTVALAAPGEPARVRAANGQAAEMHLRADVLRVMDGPTQVRLADNPVVMFNAFSPKVADNYAGMFVLDHIHNDGLK